MEKENDQTVLFDLWGVILDQEKAGKVMVDAYRKQAIDEDVNPETIETTIQDYNKVLQNDKSVSDRKVEIVDTLQDLAEKYIEVSNDKKIRSDLEASVYEDSIKVIEDAKEEGYNIAIFTTRTAEWIRDYIEQEIGEIYDAPNGKTSERFDEVCANESDQDRKVVSFTEDAAKALKAAQETDYVIENLVYINRGDNGLTREECEELSITYTENLEEVYKNLINYNGGKKMNNWVSRWAGSYTFISCSYWAPQYNSVLNRILGKGFDTTLFVHKKGNVSFLVKKNELDNLGNYLADKVKEDKSYAITLLGKLIENYKIIMKQMNELQGKILTQKQYNQFMEGFEKHLAYHVFMKKTVDYLPTELLNELLPKFRETRLYSEKVYTRTEKFFRGFASAISDKESVDAELLTCLAQKDIEKYISEGILPDQDILKERFESAVILYKDGELKILTGAAADKFEENRRNSESNDDLVKGLCKRWKS